MPETYRMPCLLIRLYHTLRPMHAKGTNAAICTTCQHGKQLSKTFPQEKNPTLSLTGQPP